MMKWDSRYYLGKDNKAGAQGIELGVHGAGQLLAAAQGQAHVGAVGHAVGPQRAVDGLLRGWPHTNRFDTLKGERNSQ